MELVREPGKELAAVPVYTHTHTHTHTLTPAPGARATARAGRLAWQTPGLTEPRAAFRKAESLWRLAECPLLPCVELALMRSRRAVVVCRHCMGR